MEAFSVPPELTEYVSSPDHRFEWGVVGQLSGFEMLRLKTQQWRGIEWVHSLAVTSGWEGATAAILYITGGEPNDLDLADLARVAACSGLPAAMLFNIPIQPLFEREEDALIAYTFDQFLENGDATWPLLFPMVKSVLRAMDALTAWLGNPELKFVLMGESKRAWTAWLTACTGDPRVIGIVSTVFDNLNMAAQLAHQRDLWESISPQLDDYSELKLPERVDSAAGRRLVAMVDPLSYVGRVAARVLLVHGANDAYWAVDALSLYRECLPGGTGIPVRPGLVTLPNEGHVFRDKSAYYATAGAYARACSLNLDWPYLESKLDERNIIFVKLIISERYSPLIRRCRLFVAESESGDFSKSAWEIEGQRNIWPDEGLQFGLPVSSSEFQAALVQVELELEFPGLRSCVALSTPTVLLRGGRDVTGRDPSPPR